MCVQLLSGAQCVMTPWTVACHSPLSMGFPRREYKSWLPFPSPGDLPNPGTEPVSLSFFFFFFFLICSEFCHTLE